MIKRLLIVLSLLACSAVAQNARFDGIVLNRNGVPLAGASIAVCLQPVTGTVPCTNPAPLCSSASDATCTSPNPVTADSLGNYFGYVKPGKYTLQFYGSGLTTRTQADQILACDPSNCYISGSMTFTAIADPVGALGQWWLSSTNAGRFKWYDGSAIRTAVDENSTESLSNKTCSSCTLPSPIITGTPTGTGVPTFTQKTGSALGVYTSTNTSLGDVDATNLSYTVTIPTGWKLSIIATFNAFQSTGTAGMQFALADGGVTLMGSVQDITPAAVNTNQAIMLLGLVTGDGASHTIRLRSNTTNAGNAWNITNATAQRTPIMVFQLSPSN